MDGRESNRMTDEYREFLNRILESKDDENTPGSQLEKSVARRVKLNGACMRSENGAHAYISKKLKFPSCYGNNLDALLDMLSTLGQPVIISIKNTGELRANLGEYGKAILDTFAEARRYNGNLYVVETD